MPYRSSTRIRWKDDRIFFLTGWPCDVHPSLCPRCQRRPGCVPPHWAARARWFSGPRQTKEEPSCTCCSWWVSGTYNPSCGNPRHVRSCLSSGAWWRGRWHWRRQKKTWWMNQWIMNRSDGPQKQVWSHYTRGDDCWSFLAHVGLENSGFLMDGNPSILLVFLKTENTQTITLYQSLYVSPWMIPPARNPSTYGFYSSYTSMCTIRIIRKISQWCRCNPVACMNHSKYILPCTPSVSPPIKHPKRYLVTVPTINSISTLCRSIVIICFC